VAKDRGPLGRLADRIRKESPVPIFPCEGLPEDADRIQWDGDDVGDFLSLIPKVGASILYLLEGVVEKDEDDAEEPEHVGETAFVEAAFLRDGTFHVFVEIAEWAEEDEEVLIDATRAASLKLVEALEARKGELVQEFVADLETRPILVNTGPMNIESEFRRFVEARFPLPGLRPGYTHPAFMHDSSPLILLIQQIAGDISMDLSAKQAEEERKMVEPLVAECVSWAAQNGLTTVAMGDVETFLDEKRIRLSHPGLRLLWNRVRTALRALKK
jgi:hypothetical protein